MNSYIREMVLFRGWNLTILLVMLSAGWSAAPLTLRNHLSDSGPNPTLINTCLITGNVGRLVTFYEAILGIKAKWSGETYAEFSTGAGVLAIFSQKAQEQYIPGSTEAANNKGVILEFRVSDLTKEYGRLQPLVQIWVKLPSSTPWGTRSMYFRDP